MLKLHSVTRVVVAAAVVLLLQGGRAFAGDQDFELHNETGTAINSVFVSPHNAKDWQEDVLGKDTLADGDSVKITFSPKEQADMWDLKVEDKDGNNVTWENLKLTEITDVTLKIDKNGDPVAETKNGDE